MNIYDTSKIPSWIIIPIVRIARSYHSLQLLLKGKKGQRPSFLDYQKNRPLGFKPVICYAPFKSLYFGVDLSVIPCCMNRTHILGTYPEMNLKEIWEGRQINQLREELMNFDLSSGCQLCLHNIESGNYDAVTAKQFDTLPLHQQYPVMMEFEISNTCNLQCIMCSEIYSSAYYETGSGRPLQSPVFDDKFLAELEEFLPHLKKAKFLGGEPFLIPIYFKIWEMLIRVNPSCIIIVQTNATILNKKIKSMLDKGNFRISVSIDSFSIETYQSIRRNGNFEIVMEHIEFFSKHASKNNYPFSIAVCPMQQNWKEIPEIVQKCNEMDALIMFNIVLKPVECSLFNLSIKNLQEVFGLMKATDLPEKTTNEKRNKAHFNDFLKLLQNWINEKGIIVIEWHDAKYHLENVSLSGLLVKLKDIADNYYTSQTTLSAEYKRVGQFIYSFSESIKDHKDEEYIKRTIYNLIQQDSEEVIARIKNLIEKNSNELIEEIIIKGKEEEEIVRRSEN